MNIYKNPVNQLVINAAEIRGLLDITKALSLSLNSKDLYKQNEKTRI
jgi:hypothetical protein